MYPGKSWFVFLDKLQIYDIFIFVTQIVIYYVFLSFFHDVGADQQLER